MARHDLGNDEALRYVEERLRALGVIRALEAAGFQPGDDVGIAGHRVRARSRCVDPLTLGARRRSCWPSRLSRPPAAATTARKPSRPARLRPGDQGEGRGQALRRASDRRVRRALDGRRPGPRVGRQAAAQEHHGAAADLRITKTELDGDEATVTAVLSSQASAGCRTCAWRRRTATGSWAGPSGDDPGTPPSRGLRLVFCRDGDSRGEARLEHRGGSRRRRPNGGARGSLRRGRRAPTRGRRPCGRDVGRDRARHARHGPPGAPSAMEELQAASAVGQVGSIAATTSCWGRAACRAPRYC